VGGDIEMKTVLIISPHFPPSNLAAVHRSRLFAQHLPSFGWLPIILTVDEKYYEEKLDYNLEKLLPPDLRIEKVAAFSVTKPRLLGDIGLRAFFQLYKKAKQLIKNEQIDFLYIPIPSFYCALLGRWLNSTTNVQYGIDYIDPWVHSFPGSNKIFSRHWFSTHIAKLLEPVAIKKASLITGVAEGYFTEVFKRNPFLKSQAISAGMPYGGEQRDHAMLDKLTLSPSLFQKKSGKFILVYAGAMLPKAYKPLENIFSTILQNQTIFENTEFHFIGTGKTPDDEFGFNIRPLAEKYGLWETVVFEYPRRLPYLDVLAHLKIAHGIFILGSTEPHYTPSKTYQGVLSARPILAVLHQQSTAVKVLKESGAGLVLEFDGEAGLDKIAAEFAGLFKSYLSFARTFDIATINQHLFDAYSAKNITGRLAGLLNMAYEKNKLIHQP
jgi:hypothetical protein